ncbi:MAG: hypothetical protein JNJ70_24365 [Verrucomicrobiales bacterium]|nr:hypothetical protein [Verrucomicrobiales bacterium]
MDPAPDFPRSVFRSKGLVFNLVCGAYFLFLSPHVVSAVQAGAKGEGKAVWLGVLLILLMLLEVRSLPAKLKIVHVALRDQRTGDATSAGVFFLWMFHAVISILVFLQAMAAFGAEPVAKDGSGDLPVWMGALVFLVVIKELYLLGPIWLTNGAKSPAKLHARPRPEEGFHDLVLVSYACLAYSLVSGLMEQQPLPRGEPLALVVNVFAASVVFLIFYLPMRIPYQIEEWAAVRSRGDFWRWVLSILAALVPAVWALR